MTDQLERWLSPACVSRAMAWNSINGCYDRVALVLAADNFTKACELLGIDRYLSAGELVEMAIERHETLEDYERPLSDDEEPSTGIWIAIMVVGAAFSVVGAALFAVAVL